MGFELDGFGIERASLLWFDGENFFIFIQEGEDRR
jgi:hypothetical protein